MLYSTKASCYVVLSFVHPFCTGVQVMNTEAEIVQAFEDYRSGKLGAIEGVEERYGFVCSLRCFSTFFLYTSEWLEN